MKALKLAGLLMATSLILAGCDNGGKKRGSANPYGYGQTYNQNCVQNAQGQWVDRNTGQIRNDCLNNGYNNGYNCQNQVYDQNMCHRYVGPHWVDINGRPVPQGVNCNQQCNGSTQFNGLYPGNIADECTYTYGQGSYRVVVGGRLYCTSPYYYNMYNLGGSAYLYSDYYGYSRCRIRTGRLGPFYGQYYYCY